VDDLNNLDLSDFFSAVSVGKKQKKEKTESIIGQINLDSVFEEVSVLKTKSKIKNKKGDKALKAFEELLSLKEVESIVEEEVVEEVIDEEVKEEPKKLTLIEKSLGLLSEPSDVKQQQDPITPLDQKFATLDDLQKHYSTFLSRIQQQLSTLGGGGETRLEFLDDVDRDSAKRDNYFLKYDANINKWVGDDGGGVGITSIVFITGVTTYYSATRDVDYIGVSADVPVTIDLPISPAAGKEIIIKDEGNKISTYNITVRAGVGASVENDSSVIMKINHESFTYFYNGYNWYIV
jgi:hypothetical protein